MASHLTIGALARASGVPTGTLRTWERRYGFPVPARDDGGQRLYDPAMIDRVRDVAAAIRLGWRPAQAVNADVTEVRRFLRREDLRPTPEGWLAAVLEADDTGLGALLHRDWDRLGARAFLEDRLVPFFPALCSALASGRATSFHERLAIEHLRAFLTERWRTLSEPVSTPVAICATLPGERHDLGLHVAAVTLALAETRVIWLGTETPVEELVHAAEAFAPAAVAIGVSGGSDPAQTSIELVALRDALPPTVGLWVGGSGCGALTGVPTVRTLAMLDELRADL